MQGFSYFLGLFQVIMANPVYDPNLSKIFQDIFPRETSSKQQALGSKKEMRKSSNHPSGQFITTSHDLTPNGGLVMEIPFFQGNLGWWNIIYLARIIHVQVQNCW